MDEAERYELFRQELISLICSINEEVPLSEQNQVLIVYTLNTIEKIMKFNSWVQSRLKDGVFQATEAEITRAAVQASK